MAFGQQSGPPATHRQVQELLALVIEAGHADFREARGPLGFTQRQAGGKFTRDEAAAYIDQLMAPDGSETSDGAGPSGGSSVASAPGPRRDRVTAAERTEAAQLRQLRAMPPELLAGELQRRGWAVIAP